MRLRETKEIVDFKLKRNLIREIQSLQMFKNCTKDELKKVYSECIKVYNYGGLEDLKKHKIFCESVNEM